MMMRTIRKENGFTLMELLLLIALAIVAAVIFLPTMNSSHDSFPRTQCLSNLKQIGLAIGMYADSYNQQMPLDSRTPTLAGSMRLLSKVSNGKPFFCPADNRRHAKPEMDAAKLTVNNISYSYAPGQAWQDASPDSVVALDRIYTTVARSAWPSNGNHKWFGGNILYNDGHVDFKTSLPHALKDKTGKEIVLSP